MKANEIEDGKVLMIGDLIVGCIETDIVGEATYKILCKVTDINHYGDVRCEALKPFPDELDWQDGDDFSWIEPIPLTPEILEKNGFEDIGDDIYQLEEKPCWFWVDFFRHTYGCEYDTSTYEHEDDEHRLKLYGIPSVHELQHALRLCGIEKEIEL